MFHFATQNLTTVYTTNTVPDSDLESGFLCGVVLIRKYSLEHGHETKHDGQRTCELLMHLELNKSGIREF